MMKRTGISVALGAVLLALCLSAPGRAEEQVRWGTVDAQRVESEYKGMQEAYRQFQVLVQEQQQQLQEKFKTRLLLDDEQQEFLDSTQIAAPTEGRDKRLSELEDLVSQREKKLEALQQKGERTPDEEEEYRKLNQLYERRINELNMLRGELQETQQAKGEELLKKVKDDLEKAVTAVAEEKKLAIVFQKELVLYGGVDITDEVLAKLNEEQAN